MNIIEIEGLTKKFKDTEALRGLSLQVPEGCVRGFLGRNGAGKTTTLKILLGMTRAGSGSARVFGLDCADAAQSVAIRQRIGFVSETKALYPYMTIGETIRFTAGFFPKWRRDLEERYLKLFELPKNRGVAKLSKGTLSKLVLLLGMCRGAELLILDEPTDGLDPAVTEDVLQAVVDLAAQEGVTVFFSSHQLHEVEQIADSVCIIEQGRTVLQSDLDDLRASYRQVQLVFVDDAPRAGLQRPGVERLQQSGRSVSLLVSRDVEGVVEAARNHRATSINVRPVSLKEIFLSLVRVS